MSKEEVDKQVFQVLIEKYLDGKTTLEELKLLVNYYESYQQESAWTAELESEEVVRNRVLINIMEELHDNNKVIPFYQKSIFKYAVVASIVVLISFTFLFKNNNIKDIEVVNTRQPNNIEIGTDKATLTLADASQVVLENGESFQRQNIRSNGEEIVYDTEDVKPEVIEYNYLTIPTGGQFSIKLSDGTKVWLNSESQLKYPVSFIDGETRKVELVYGEAYFDVSPSTEHNGAKFKVINKDQEVEVIGTEFNIKAYKDDTDTYTTLVKGKVALSYDDKKQNLVPNQQSHLDFNTNTLTLKTIDVYNEISWKQGVFSFENKSLKEIMKVLARWYDMEVFFVNQESENIEFNGILDKNQNIEDILKIIKNFKVINDYKINNKAVIIK